MRYLNTINEFKVNIANLYHFSSINRSTLIIPSNYLKANDNRYFINGETKKINSISLSRNKDLDKIPDDKQGLVDGSYQVRYTLDYSKLKHNHKIIPIDNRITYITKEDGAVEYGNDFDYESEEIIVNKNIEELDSYIVEIRIFKENKHPHIDELLGMMSLKYILVKEDSKFFYFKSKTSI